MTDREVMQMALETLDNMAKVDWREWDEFASVEDFVRWAKSRASFTAEALRAALAQPEPEPVWELQEGGWDTVADADWMETLPVGTKLYTAPPQRESTCAECDKKQSDGWALYCVGCLREFYKDDPTNKREWVGLTDAELEDCILISEWATWIEVGRAIEAKLKDKNI